MNVIVSLLNLLEGRKTYLAAALAALMAADQILHFIPLEWAPAVAWAAAALGLVGVRSAINKASGA